MKRKLKLGEHYWWMRHEQFPMDIIKVEEIVAGGKELVIYGLILECDKLRVYRRKDISEENILKPVPQKVLNDYKEKMERVIVNFFQ